MRCIGFNTQSTLDAQQRCASLVCDPQSSWCEQHASAVRRPYAAYKAVCERVTNMQTSASSTNTMDSDSMAAVNVRTRMLFARRCALDRGTFRDAWVHPACRDHQHDVVIQRYLELADFYESMLSEMQVSQQRREHERLERLTVALIKQRSTEESERSERLARKESWFREDLKQLRKTRSTRQEDERRKQREEDNAITAIQEEANAEDRARISRFMESFEQEDDDNGYICKNVQVEHVALLDKLRVKISQCCPGMYEENRADSQVWYHLLVGVIFIPDWESYDTHKLSSFILFCKSRMSGCYDEDEDGRDLGRELRSEDSSQSMLFRIATIFALLTIREMELALNRVRSLLSTGNKELKRHKLDDYYGSIMDVCAQLSHDGQSAEH